jgi:hypothetical protein
MEIHIWEGQNPFFVLAPIILTFLLGFLYLFLSGRLERNLQFLAGVVAGLLFVGSGLMTLTQMILAFSTSSLTVAAALTAGFVIAQITLGLALLGYCMRTTTWNLKNRIILIIIGLLGFVTWSGVIIGPLLAIVAALLPSYKNGIFKYEGI